MGGLGAANGKRQLSLLDMTGPFYFSGVFLPCGSADLPATASPQPALSINQCWASRQPCFVSFEKQFPQGLCLSSIGKWKYVGQLFRNPINPTPLRSNKFASMPA